jgi:hypothetical protein
MLFRGTSRGRNWYAWVKNVKDAVTVTEAAARKIIKKDKELKCVRATQEIIKLYS